MSEVHEPIEHVTVWSDGGTLMIRAAHGDPVRMKEEEEARALADTLYRLIEDVAPDPPYEPDDSGFDKLMHGVCVGWCFCGSVKAKGTPLHVTMFIPDDGPVTADQFVEWVFLADNLNPNVEPERWQRHKDAIRAAFIEHLGGEVADAKQLRESAIEPSMRDWPVNHGRRGQGRRYRDARCTGKGARAAGAKPALKSSSARLPGGSMPGPTFGFISDRNHQIASEGVSARRADCPGRRV
jgi:hypothetical protein